MGEWHRVPGQLPESTPEWQRNRDNSIYYKSCKLTSVSLWGGEGKGDTFFLGSSILPLCHVLLMEGAPIPSLYPPFPANPVVMNVVSQFTVYDLVLGNLESPRPWQYYVSLWTNLQEERGRQE